MTTGPKRSGRRARHAQRAAKPVINPCPPGQRGGQYRPLTDADLQAIYATTLRLLAELGMGQVPDRLRKLLLEHGANERPDGRVCMPAKLVQEAIDSAAKTFPLYGRDPARDIHVGDDRVYFRRADP